MKYLVLALTTIAACVGAFLLTTMGLDYINPDIARGLHPLIAFPLATLLLSSIGVLVMASMSIEDDPFDNEQEAAVIALSKDGIHLNWPPLK